MLLFQKSLYWFNRDVVTDKSGTEKHKNNDDDVTADAFQLDNGVDHF